MEFVWIPPGEYMRGGETHPVGHKRPSPAGLYDIYGNVWEWCSDRFGDYPEGVVTDPTGPDSGSHRVHLGGSWDHAPWRCRSAHRHGDPPDYRNCILGFRVVLDFP